ncbi:transglutaminase domain-containing protein [Spirillospora sp. NPDC049024]
MSGGHGASGTAELTEFLDTLLLVPHAVRDFEVPRAQAETAYLLPAGVLEAMAAAGLAADRPSSPDGPCFDHFDLLNVSLELRVANPWAFGPGAWGRALRASVRRPSTRVEVEPIPECSGAEHRGGDCSLTVRLPEGWRPYTADSPPVLRRELRTSWPAPDAGTSALLEEFGRLRFVRLPALVGNDPEFIRRTGVADCNGAARLMAEEGARRGLNCRLAHGVILSPPFSIAHYWTEVETDGIWVPHDPLIVNAMVRWGILDGAEWDIYRSTGAILVRLTDKPGALALDHGEPVGVSFATRLPT